MLVYSWEVEISRIAHGELWESQFSANTDYWLIYTERMLYNIMISSIASWGIFTHFHL